MDFYYCYCFSFNLHLSLVFIQLGIMLEYFLLQSQAQQTALSADVTWGSFKSVVRVVNYTLSLGCAC